MILNVLDLFAGAGGFSEGFKEAGYNIAFANEIDNQIALTYKENHKETKLFIENIKTFKERVINLSPKPNIIIGGPPCQGFSLAGARNRKEKHNKFINDERNYLFKEYVSIAKIIRPVAFIIENVVGLVNMNNGEIFREIIDILSDPEIMGENYHIETNLIDMSQFGVPQQRKRIIIVGYKTAIRNNNFFVELDKLKEQPQTVFDAIGDLQNKEINVPNHTPTKHTIEAIQRMHKILPGQNFRQLNDNSIKSIHSGSYGRMDWNKQAKTITTRFDTPSGGEYIHPALDRTITPREAARIQTFSDDYIFYGPKSSIIKQIGNAVPPKMAYKLAVTLKKLLKEE